GEIGHRFARLSRLRDNPAERAFEYARLYPGEFFFPQFPLSALLAEHRARHSDAGIDDLNFAHVTIPPKQLQAGLPTNMRAIAFHGRAQGPTLVLLPEFDQTVAAPESLGSEWTIRARRQ